MPELPEVETVRRLLERRLTGKRINSVEIIVPKILRGMESAAFAEALTDCQIAAVGRRGKYLIFTLAPPPGHDPAASALIIHLKMRGSLRVEKQTDPPGAYLCAALVLEDGFALRFYDMWRWGEWTLLPAGVPLSELPSLSGMGPEPFDPDFTAEYLIGKLRGRRALLKPLLLGQQVVAGLGNIYCDECLHLARLHPARSAGSLSREEIQHLHSAIHSVLRQAVEQGGARAENLAKQNENLDSFDEVYIPQIYDRPGSPCPVCGRGLIKYHLNGRGTTYCPNCQPDAEFPDFKSDRTSSRAEKE